MKRQYLGDSKDSFTWDYHDFLTAGLGYPLFNIVLMLTSDDGTGQGRSRPELFPARPEVIAFCRQLRSGRNFQYLRRLPVKTNADYRVRLHKGRTVFAHADRQRYFSGFSADRNQVILLDPDNGFRPDGSAHNKHILYSDIDYVLEQISDSSVLTVFQHFRYIPFDDDFRRIRSRLPAEHATAIYWRSIMFVAVSRSGDAVERVRAVNRRYAENRPVQCVG